MALEGKLVGREKTGKRGGVRWTEEEQKVEKKKGNSKKWLTEERSGSFCDRALKLMGKLCSLLLKSDF